MKTIDVKDDLKTIYDGRFNGREDYRQKVWRILVSDFFQPFIPRSGVVLELGCGHGEFVNQVNGPTCYAMDLNPDSGRHLNPGIVWLQQDCSARWPLPDNSLDLVFTSNFFEHLPDKPHLLATLTEAHRCIKPGGHVVAVGPNIKYTGGKYWDFWDHHIPLTEASLGEALQSVQFNLKMVTPRFLPYTMSSGRSYPLFLLRIYLRLPLVWRLFGRQFLIVADK